MAAEVPGLGAVEAAASRLVEDPVAVEVTAVAAPM